MELHCTGFVRHLVLVVSYFISIFFLCAEEGNRLIMDLLG